MLSLVRTSFTEIIITTSSYGRRRRAWKWRWKMWSKRGRGERLNGNAGGGVRVEAFVHVNYLFGWFTNSFYWFCSLLNTEAKRTASLPLRLRFSRKHFSVSPPSVLFVHLIRLNLVSALDLKPIELSVPSARWENDALFLGNGETVTVARNRAGRLSKKIHLANWSCNLHQAK